MKANARSRNEGKRAPTTRTMKHPTTERIHQGINEQDTEPRAQRRQRRRPRACSVSSSKQSTPTAHTSDGAPYGCPCASSGLM
eukprot:4421208-Pleurochrysis_carterae.AAC.1